MLAKKIILSVLIIALAAGGYFAARTFTARNIETVSAKIIIDTENITANTSGTLKSINVQPYQTVKEGDIIATVSKISPAYCHPPKNKNDKKAAQTYENAAIMYKDGIITKEQYDASLKEYRQYKNAQVCVKQSETVNNVYSLFSGKIELDDNISVGEEVQENTVIAAVQKDSPKILAYFSPKDKRYLKIGQQAEITIIKYPEMAFTGTLSAKDKIDIYGLAIKININEDVSNLNIKNGDAAIVKIVE